MKKPNKGFSLLELLIVVSIILIIATIAIPSLLRSRQAAHEAAAVATLRTLNTAEVTYLLTAQGKYGTLANMVAAGLIPSNFTTGAVSGYVFLVTLDTATFTDFTVSANPASTNEGRYAYYMVADGVIRYSTAAAYAPNSAAAGTPVTQ